MKKILSVLFAVLTVGAMALPKEAEAQVLYSNRCCDASLTVRCIITPSAPVGNACWCYGQGAGVVC